MTLRVGGGTAAGVGVILGASVLAARSHFFFQFAAGHLGTYDRAAALNIAARGLDLLVLILLVTLAAGLGMRLARLRPPTGVGDGAGMLLAPAVGLGALALVILGFGRVGLLRAGPVAILLVAALAAGGAGGFLWLAGLTARCRGALASRGSVWEALLVCGISIPILATLIVALAPPIDWDSLAYHLALPAIYIREGRLLPLEWNYFAPWPAVMEMLYSLALAVRGDRLAQLIHWVSLVGCAAVIGTLAGQGGGRRGALIGAALFLSFPTVVHIGGTCHNDLGLVACVLLGLLALLERRPGVAGFLLGTGAVCKVHGVLYLVPIWLWAWREQGRRAAGWICAGAAVALLPWAFKNPGDWVGGMDHGLALWVDRIAKQKELAENPAIPDASWMADVARLPWVVLSEPGRLAHEALPFSPRWSLLGLSLVLLGSLRSRAESPIPIRFLWVLAAFEIAVWIATQEMLIRYLLPTVAILCVLAGSRAGAILGSGGASPAAARAGPFSPGPRPALIVAGCCMALLPLVTLSVRDELFPVAGPSPAGGRSHEARYLDIMFAAYPAFEFINDNLPADSTVFLFQESRSYYCGRRWVDGDPKTHEAVDYRSLTGPEDLMTRLRALGVTHVLRNSANPLYQPTPGHFTPRIIGLMDAVLRRHGRRLFAARGVEVYAVVINSTP